MFVPVFHGAVSTFLGMFGLFLYSILGPEYGSLHQGTLDGIPLWNPGITVSSPSQPVPLPGIVMLVFSEFDFVIKYFFVVMSVLVMLGIFNGLCLLPVMLIVCGPQCEVSPFLLLIRLILVF